jgi:TonB family protein
MSQVIYEYLLVKSVGISILMLFVLVARLPALKYSNAAIAYSLWWILPIYLVLPINLVDLSSTSQIMTIFARGSQMVIELNSLNNFKEYSISTIVTTIWSAGFIFSIALYVRQYRLLHASLHSFKLESSAASNLQLNKRKSIKVVTSNLVNYPAVFGVLSNYLIVPSNFNQFHSQKQEMILRHELYHLSRRDHKSNVIRAIIKCIFWFNPVVYFVEPFFEIDQEMSCDLGVLRKSNKIQRKVYAEVLLDSVAALRPYPLISQWKYQSLIKERFKMLNKTSSKKWHSWLVCMLAVSSIWVTSGTVLAKKETSVAKEARPVVMIQPRYPREAAINGVEGWVKLKLDVDSQGKPINISVVDAMPQGVFENDALKAIAKWRFSPLGEQKNMVYTMEFKVE